MNFQLDYQIHELLNNYHIGGCYKYDHIEWRVRIHNEELLNNLNSTLNLNLKLNEINVVSKETAQDIKKYCWDNIQYIGTYGTEYLNPTF